MGRAMKKISSTGQLGSLHTEDLGLGRSPFAAGCASEDVADASRRMRAPAEAPSASGRGFGHSLSAGTETLSRCGAFPPSRRSSNMRTMGRSPSPQARLASSLRAGRDGCPTSQSSILESWAMFTDPVHPVLQSSRSQGRLTNLAGANLSLKGTEMLSSGNLASLEQLSRDSSMLDCAELHYTSRPLRHRRQHVDVVDEDYEKLFNPHSAPGFNSVGHVDESNESNDAFPNDCDTAIFHYQTSRSSLDEFLVQQQSSRSSLDEHAAAAHAGEGERPPRSFQVHLPTRPGPRGPRQTVPTSPSPPPSWHGARTPRGPRGDGAPEASGRPRREPKFSLDEASRQQLDVRIQRSRQTMDFVNWQLDKFSRLSIAKMSVWAALDLAAEVPACGPLNYKQQAMAAAEACRAAFPALEWAALVGLIHHLGVLLLHPTFGAEPEWAVHGESYPLGCRFEDAISGYQYFSVCPDRRRRIYNTDLGIYSPGCGLENVYFTWSAAEYMFTMLLLNDSSLPPEALFLIRYHRFASLHHGAYDRLLSDEDRALIPLLARFVEATSNPQQPVEGALSGDAFRSYYDALIQKYLGPGELVW